MKKKITKSVVDGLKPADLVWDTEINGFGIRCQTQQRVYVLKVRIRGKQHWLTIGTHGSPWTPKSARLEALRLLGAAAAGADISELRQGKKQRCTVADLAERFLSDYARIYKKASSVKTDEANLKNHVIPLLGRKYADEITSKHIEKCLQDIAEGKTAPKNRYGQMGPRGGAVATGGQGVSNRCRALLSKIFNLAEKWEVLPLNSNPVRHTQRFKENAVERFLSSEEFTRLGEVLKNEEKNNPESVYQVAAIRLLILTGARLNDILTLKWRMLDFERQLAFLPDSKSGKKSIPLSNAAITVLQKLPQVLGNDFVIVGRNEGQHLVNLRKPWVRVRRLAELEDVRLHDLRHSFASAAITAGHSLSLVSKLLGHKDSRTTQRYAHLADSVVLDAGNSTANSISESLLSSG